MTAMPEDTATAPIEAARTPVRPTRPQAPSQRIHTRVRHGMRRPHNWFQLVKFCIVGGSGFVVNVSVFFVVNHLLGVHHIASATLAFVIALFNNFWWNRHWTFGKHGAREHHAGFQAARFPVTLQRSPRASSSAPPGANRSSPRGVQTAASSPLR